MSNPITVRTFTQVTDHLPHAGHVVKPLNVYEAEDVEGALTAVKAAMEDDGGKIKRISITTEAGWLIVDGKLKYSADWL